MRNHNNLSAVWIATWKCNLNCSYCINKLSGITHEQSTGIPEPINSTLWADTWNRYSPKSLIISGGEIFLIPNITDILVKLNHSISLHLNTNLTQDMSEVLERIVPRRSLFFFASCHPLQQDYDEFFNKVKQIKEHGFNITVAFIAYPKQLNKFFEIQQRCNELEVALEVDICLDMYNSISYTPEEKNIAKSISTKHKHYRINKKLNDKTLMCSGGYNYLCADPNGNAFSCISKTTRGIQQESIGNILTDSVLSTACMQKCTYGRCHPCDEERTNRLLIHDYK